MDLQQQIFLSHDKFPFQLYSTFEVSSETFSSNVPLEPKINLAIKLYMLKTYNKNIHCNIFYFIYIFNNLKVHNFAGPLNLW